MADGNDVETGQTAPPSSSASGQHQQGTTEQIGSAGVATQMMYAGAFGAGPPPPYGMAMPPPPPRKAGRKWDWKIYCGIFAGVALIIGVPLALILAFCCDDLWVLCCFACGCPPEGGPGTAEYVGVPPTEAPLNSTS